MPYTVAFVHRVSWIFICPVENVRAKIILYHIGKKLRHYIKCHQMSHASSSVMSCVKGLKIGPKKCKVLFERPHTSGKNPDRLFLFFCSSLCRIVCSLQRTKHLNFDFNCLKGVRPFDFFMNYLYRVCHRFRLTL